jgi:hypothetical protein
MKKARGSFQTTESNDSLRRLVDELVSTGFSPPFSYAWLGRDGSAHTGIYREENGRLVCRPTSQWSPSGRGDPPPLIGLFVDKEGEIALLCIDVQGQARAWCLPSPEVRPPYLS